MFCFPISDHVIVPQRAVCFSCFKFISLHYHNQRQWKNKNYWDKKLSTVEPYLTATVVTWSPCYYGHLFKKKTSLVQSLINVGHILKSQTIQSFTISPVNAATRQKFRKLKCPSLVNFIDLKS